MHLLTTQHGLERTRARLAGALAEYERIVAGNAEAADAGDSSVWHDNFAYEENQRQMHQWARRIRDLREMIRRMEIVRPDPQPTRVQLGCRVLIADLDTDQEFVWEIAGYEDGDPEAGRVSYTSPLATSMALAFWPS